MECNGIVQVYQYKKKFCLHEKTLMYLVQISEQFQSKSATLPRETYSNIGAEDFMLCFLYPSRMITYQESFWVWAKPMSDDVILQRRRSLGEPILRMTRPYEFEIH